MSDYLLTLPVELIHKILDNVPSTDIFSSVCFVSKRFRSISLNYPRFRLDLSRMDTLINKNHFDTICTQLLHSTSQVISLTLFDKDDSMVCMKNELFLSRFNIIDTVFSNLRSLTLTYINYDTWYLLKTRLPPLLTTFSIRLAYRIVIADSLLISTTLTELLFLSPFLKRLSVKIINFLLDRIRIYAVNTTILSPVEYLRIDGICVDLSSLLTAVPLLHTLEGQFYIGDFSLDAIQPRLLYLQRLKLESGRTEWIQLTSLLSLFPQLVHLIVIIYNANSNIVDGFAWAQLLQSIKHFEFKFHFFSHVFEHQSINLDSFRTKFWLEEKRWFVTYVRGSHTKDQSYLYSNSSSTIQHPTHEVLGILTSESTTSESTLFPHVHHLTINDKYIKYPCLHRYTHVKKLSLSDVTTVTAPIPLKDYITASFDTSQITTCHITSSWDTQSFYQCIDFLQSLPRLHRVQVSPINLNYFFLYQLSNITDLKIEKNFNDEEYVLNPNDINVFCHSFPQVKRLDIPLFFTTDLPQLLNRMKMNLTNIIIEQPYGMGKEQLITREWLKRNMDLQNFSYKCDCHNIVQIWLQDF